MLLKRRFKMKMTPYTIDNGESLPIVDHNTPYIETSPSPKQGGSYPETTISVPGSAGGANPSLTISTPQTSVSTPTSAMNGGMV